MSLKKRSKKLVSVLTTSMLITAAREKFSGNAETDENSKNGDENWRTNLVQVFYICYSITF